TQRQRQRRLLTASFAIAASVTIAVAWYEISSNAPQLRPLSSGPLPLAGATSTVASGERAQAVVRAQHRAGEGTSNLAVDGSGGAYPVARFIAGGDGIAVPIASDSPEVTIVQV